MQPLLDGVRAGLTRDEVNWALSGSSDVEIDASLFLVDERDQPLADVTAALLIDGARLDHDSTVDIAGVLTCVLEPAAALGPDGQTWRPAWGRDRVQPRMRMRGTGGDWVEFVLGTYVITTPESQLDADTFADRTYQVTGYDKMYLVSGEIGDSYAANTGQTVTSVIYDLLSQANNAAGGPVSPRVLFELSSVGEQVLAAPRGWPLTRDHSYTYLEVINDLLSSVGAAPMWVDWNGYFRIQPVTSAAAAGTEYVFVAGDATGKWDRGSDYPLSKSVLAWDGRYVRQDLWNVPNWWKFIQSGFEGVPANGSGVYLAPANQSDGPTSFDAVGRWVRHVEFLNAETQADLVAQGDAIVAKYKAQAEVFTFNSGPLPIAWHGDVLGYSDPQLEQTERKLRATSWSLPFDGSDMSWVCETVRSSG